MIKQKECEFCLGENYSTNTQITLSELKYFDRTTYLVHEGMACETCIEFACNHAEDLIIMKGD